MSGYAALADTPEEAREALDLLEQDPALRPSIEGALESTVLGRVYALTGRVGDALPLLQQAGANCFVLQSPRASLQAYESLGLALEKTGDPEAACEAHKVVLDHWGEAQPRSIVADAARDRFRALGCALGRRRHDAHTTSSR
jgi:tetratricopeptide (TPR) repeat protein